MIYLQHLQTIPMSLTESSCTFCSPVHNQVCAVRSVKSGQMYRFLWAGQSDRTCLQWARPLRNLSPDWPAPKGLILHYYNFNIGDYASHTRHLTLLENLAFRLLLDEYYLKERPLDACSTSVARLIGMRDYQQEVDAVLNEFFTLTDEGWAQARADKEIEHYQDKLKKASNAGKASALQRTLNGRSADVQPNSKQETVNSKQIKSKTLSGKPDVLPFLYESKEVLKFLNQKTGHAYQEVKSNTESIAARFKEGATLADMKAIIASKVREWSSDEKMCKHLRPATLFNRTNYWNYQGQLLQVDGHE